MDLATLREQTEADGYPPDFYAFLLFLYHLSPWAALFSHFSPALAPLASDMPPPQADGEADGKADGDEGPADKHAQAVRQPEPRPAPESKQEAEAEAEPEPEPEPESKPKPQPQPEPEGESEPGSGSEAEPSQREKAALSAAAVVSTVTAATAAAFAAGSSALDDNDPPSTPVALSGVVEARTLPPSMEARSVVQFTLWPGQPLQVARLEPYNVDGAPRSFHQIPSPGSETDASKARRPLSAPAVSATPNKEKKKSDRSSSMLKRNSNDDTMTSTIDDTDNDGEEIPFTRSVPVSRDSESDDQEQTTETKSSVNLSTSSPLQDETPASEGSPPAAAVPGDDTGSATPDVTCEGVCAESGTRVDAGGPADADASPSSKAVHECPTITLVACGYSKLGKDCDCSKQVANPGEISSGSTEQVWCACGVTPIDTSDATAMLRYALRHASSKCTCVEDDDSDNNYDLGDDDDAGEWAEPGRRSSRVMECAKATFASCLPSRRASQTQAQSQAQPQAQAQARDGALRPAERPPDENVTAVVSAPGIFQVFPEVDPFGSRTTTLICEDALWPAQTQTFEFEIFEKSSHNLFCQHLDKNCINEVQGILDTIIPEEQLQDASERRNRIGVGVLELIQKLSLFNVFPENKIPLLWNLSDSILRDSDLENATRTRTELENQVDVILGTLSVYTDDTYVSQIRPHFQNLILIVMLAEQSPPNRNRLALRGNARDSIERLLNISILELQTKKNQYHDSASDILEKIFPEKEIRDESKKRSRLQEGIEELAVRVTFTINHKETPFGRKSIRRTAIIRQTEIQSFAEKVIPESNEIYDLTEKSNDVLGQIQEVVESIIPTWQMSLSSHYGSIRSDFEKLLWKIFVGHQEFEESTRSEQRESMREIMGNILWKANSEAQERKKLEIETIVNKINPERIIESLKERKDFLRSGIMDILEQINMTVEIDNSYPKNSLLSKRSLQRSNTSYLIVPELVDKIFYQETSKRKLDDLTQDTLIENLIETVISRAEAEENNNLINIRNSLRDILDLIHLAKDSQVDANTLKKSRLIARKIIKGIMDNVNKESVRKTQQLDENIDYIVNSILDAGEIVNSVKKNNTLRSSIGTLFETVCLSRPLDGAIIRDSIVGRVHLWPRKTALHSHIKKLVDRYADVEDIGSEQIRNSVQGILENVIPISSIGNDALLSNLRKEGEELLVILMSFNECIDDENHKYYLRDLAGEHIDNMILLVHQIRERSYHQDRQEKYNIVKNLLSGVDNLEKKKNEIRNGIEDLLGKIHVDQMRDRMEQGRPSQQKHIYFMKKSTLCNAVDIFVEGLVLESEDEFTSERRNMFYHRLQDLIDLATPVSVTGKNLAQKHFRVDFEELLKTVVDINNIKNNIEEDIARDIMHCRLDIVLRDVEAMDTWKRCQIFEEIEYFTKSLYPEQTVKTLEKKHRICLGIEELIEKILSNRGELSERNVNGGKLNINVSADVQKLIDMIIPDEKGKRRFGTNDIDSLIQNFIDSIIPSTEAISNNGIMETRSNLKGILDKIKQAEDAPDIESIEHVRLIARENLENILRAEEFESEMKNEQVILDVESILNKLLPYENNLSKSTTRKAMRRGLHELMKKTVHLNDGEIMILNKRVFPNKKVLKKDLKNLMTMVMPDEVVQDTPGRHEKIRAAVSNLLEKVLPLSECEENIELGKTRENFEELFGTLLSITALLYSAQERVKLRATVREQLKVIMQNANKGDQRRRSLLEFEIKSVLDKLIPEYIIEDNTERIERFTEGIENVIHSIKSTINPEYRPSNDSIVTKSSMVMERTSLREGIEKLICQVPNKSSKSNSQQELRIRFSTQEILDMHLPAPDSEEEDIFHLRESLRNLLVGTISSFSEENLEKISSIRDEARENLHGIIRISENYHIQRRESCYADAVGLLDKIIPLNYSNETRVTSLREGIVELLEKIIPSNEAEKLNKINSEVDRFVNQLVHIEDLEKSHRWTEVHRYVSQFLDSFFAVVGSMEMKVLVDCLEEFLEYFVVEAQVEKNPVTRSSLRATAQLLLEKILLIMATHEEKSESFDVSSTVCTYFSLHESGPMPSSQTLAENNLPFDKRKRKGLFSMFIPWIGKKLTRNSKSSFKGKTDEDAKVSKLRNKTDSKKKFKGKGKHNG